MAAHGDSEGDVEAEPKQWQGDGPMPCEMYNQSPVDRARWQFMPGRLDRDPRRREYQRSMRHLAYLALGAMVAVIAVVAVLSNL